MKLITGNIKWIMLVSGILTTTMLYAAIAPDAALRSNFGHDLAAAGPLAELIVRNWGVLIGLIGMSLIYGAFDPPGRRFILTLAGVSKVAFIALVLTVGRNYLGQQVGVAVVIDSLMVLLFAAYLIGSRAPAYAEPARV